MLRYLYKIQFKKLICIYICTYQSKYVLLTTQDYLLLNAAENGNMQNVSVALSDGANVNVHHQDIRKVSTSIIAHAPLIAMDIFVYLWSVSPYFKVVFDRSKSFDRSVWPNIINIMVKLIISLYNMQLLLVLDTVIYETNNKTRFKTMLKWNDLYLHIPAWKIVELQKSNYCWPKFYKNTHIACWCLVYRTPLSLTMTEQWPFFMQKCHVFLLILKVGRRFGAYWLEKKTSPKYNLNVDIPNY